MEFSKWEGLGNDYIILEAATLPGPLDAGRIALLCDRHTGVGADGILVHHVVRVEDDVSSTSRAGSWDRPLVARMQVFNPDGSEAEMCGNGIRMFAKYLRGRDLAPDGPFVILTAAGPITPELLPDGRVRVGMGKARVAEQRELQAAGMTFTYHAVDVGNPHCVIQYADLEALPLSEWGPAVERNDAFPNRTNVEFVRLEADGSITMRVWERGVGETNACGTGATAVGAAAIGLGLAVSPVVVHLLGGDLEIDLTADGSAVMTGPASEVFSGRASADLLRRLGWE